MALHHGRVIRLWCCIISRRAIMIEVGTELASVLKVLIVCLAIVGCIWAFSKW